MDKWEILHMHMQTEYMYLLIWCKYHVLVNFYHDNIVECHFKCTSKGLEWNFICYLQIANGCKCDDYGICSTSFNSSTRPLFLYDQWNRGEKRNTNSFPLISI